MFAARGILVALAFFALTYCLGSALVILLWLAMKRLNPKAAVPAAFLFALRLFPFALSVVVNIVFTLPSFWLMEKSSLDEDAGTFILAVCALLMLGFGLIRVLRAQARTRRAVNHWLLGPNRGNGAALNPMTSAANGAPPLILAGIRRPKVLVCDAAAALLNEDELQAAVRHEHAHMRCRDNLKKVLVASIPFPGMAALEAAWQEAAELEADDAAVSNRREALDLAAALIKLSRSFQQRPMPALATGLVSGASCISARVERLLEWRAQSGRPCTWPWLLLALLSLIAGIASNYHAALVLTHRLTELLVP